MFHQQGFFGNFALTKRLRLEHSLITRKPLLDFARTNRARNVRAWKLLHSSKRWFGWVFEDKAIECLGFCLWFLLRVADCLLWQEVCGRKSALYASNCVVGLAKVFALYQFGLFYYKRKIFLNFTVLIIHFFVWTSIFWTGIKVWLEGIQNLQKFTFCFIYLKSNR